MNRSVYCAASAMLTEMLKQDVHSHNLANANTTGFKRCLAEAVPNGNGSAPAGNADLRPGPLRVTDAPLDVALQSPGYFVLQTPTGRQYTRNGHFTLDAGGMLANGQGQRVLGRLGPIHLAGGRVEIAADGAIYRNGQFVDKLLVANFAPGSQIAHDANGGVVGSGTPAQVGSFTVVSGAIEQSNVNPMEELAAIRNGFRVYEANAKVITTADNTLAKLIDAATG